MDYFSDDEILEIFQDLPGKRGCPESELEAVETAYGIRFPEFYRRMMLLDAGRLVNMGCFMQPSKIIDLMDDYVDFSLEAPVFVPSQVIVAFDDTFYIAIDGVGGMDSPVYEFNYYSVDKNSKPVIRHQSLKPYVSEVLRWKLQLGRKAPGL